MMNHNEVDANSKMFCQIVNSKMFCQTMKCGCNTVSLFHFVLRLDSKWLVFSLAKNSTHTDSYKKIILQMKLRTNSNAEVSTGGILHS